MSLRIIIKLKSWNKIEGIQASREERNREEQTNMKMKRCHIQLVRTSEQICATVSSN